VKSPIEAKRVFRPLQSPALLLFMAYYVPSLLMILWPLIFSLCSGVGRVELELAYGKVMLGTR
jgi:hypothetical protein